MALLPAPCATATATARAGAATATSAATSRRIQIGAHARAGLEPQLSLGDNGFTRLQSLVDHDVVVRRAATVAIGRCSTVESALTTNTYWPSCPVCTACDGTTMRVRQRGETKRDAGELSRPQIGDRDSGRWPSA